jgi:cyclopropane fatty-acyl-phospholipid synthase-like methyltransferase
MSLVTDFLNPVRWVKAYRFQKQQKSFDKSAFDLELYLYAQMLRNDMLHYGYFEDPDVNPDQISIRQFEDAQIFYAKKIISHIQKTDEPVLDVGCGMGGLSALLLKDNVPVEALTPNYNQVSYIGKTMPGLKVHHRKFEDFKPERKFGTIINSESLQYIRLQDAFQNVEDSLNPGGRWIIADYFRTGSHAKHHSGHQMEDFFRMAAERNWKVVHEEDISLHILPTIKYVYMYASRFLMPLKHFAFEKLRYKKPWLYFLTSSLRTKAEEKMKRELMAVDPELFLSEKKYVLLVLENQNQK